MRQLTLFDKIISNVDQCIRTLSIPSSRTNRPNPSDPVAEKSLTAKQKKLSASLMRINHTGEVCAQALYLGQALTSRGDRVNQEMLTAAQEEIDHLQWCQQRLDELSSHTSYLNPAWWLGSFAIGVSAGLVGDKWSLGFVMETENQVSQHLREHLDFLPAEDEKSKAIVSQMMWDEQQHAKHAELSGAAQLPAPIPSLMTFTSKLMKAVVYYV